MACLPPNSWPSVSVLTMEFLMSLILSFPKGLRDYALGIKTLAVGVNEQGRFYHIGGFKGGKWYNRQLDKVRSKRDRCKKGSSRQRR